MPYRELRWLASLTLWAGVILGTLVVIYGIGIARDPLASAIIGGGEMIGLGLGVIFNGYFWNVVLRAAAQAGEDLAALRAQRLTSGAPTALRTQGAPPRRTPAPAGEPREASPSRPPVRPKPGDASGQRVALFRPPDEAQGGTCGQCGNELTMGRVGTTCPHCHAEFDRVVIARR